MVIDGLSQSRAGSGEPLVLLHGIGGSWRDWSPVLPSLEQRFDVLALDLPGFGVSPSGAFPATIPGHADAVEAELDRAGFAEAHFAGISSGGWAALELAKRGRARSVVGLAPAGMWGKLGDLYRFNLLRNAHYSAKVLRHHPILMRTPAQRWLLGMWLFMAHPGRWSPEEMQSSMEAMGGSANYMDFLKWTRGRRVEGLDQVSCPVLIAWGSRDLLLARTQGKRFVDALPNAEFRLLRGVGHLPTADDPSLIASTVTEFAAAASI